MSMTTNIRGDEQPLVLVINGPNLNALGRRDPGIYGVITLPEIETRTAAAAHEVGWVAELFQSNSEGDLIDAIQGATNRAGGIIINAGAYTHTSIAIRDALADCGLPVVEVHLSNVHAREAFRRVSFISDVAVAVFAGAGWRGYGYAVDFLAGRRSDSEAVQ